MQKTKTILSIVLILFTLLSWSQEQIDVQKDTLTTILGHEKMEVLANATQVKLYYIKYYLIEGTKYDYGTKPYQVATFKKEDVSSFLNEIKNSENYNFAAEKKAGFNPDIQFVIGSKENDLELILFFDKKNKKVGFINMGGQIVLNTKEKLYTYLLEKSKF